MIITRSKRMGGGFHADRQDRQGDRTIWRRAHLRSVEREYAMGPGLRLLCHHAVADVVLHIGSAQRPPSTGKIGQMTPSSGLQLRVAKHATIETWRTKMKKLVTTIMLASTVSLAALAAAAPAMAASHRHPQER